MFKRHAQGSEKTSSPIPVGETTHVVHVIIGLICLVRQDKGFRRLVLPRLL